MSTSRGIVVHKYGGSSVADIDKLRLVADKVARAREGGHDVVVVVSAMGKTTDGLVDLAKQAATIGSEARAPARRELDMLLSTGERVTMALLSIALQARGLDAISFTGSQSGIFTNDRHYDAKIIEVRPFRIEDELARGKIVIVAGYQGMSYKREITTLGRGGSDTTAVALAAALGAERCEIYSDVDGVYSADPRVVPDAEHLEAVDLELLREMSEAGAKVICAGAVEWARRARIRIVARRTADDHVMGGARETHALEGEGRGARAVVGRDPVALLAVLPKDAERAHALCAEHHLELFDAIDDDAGLRAVVPLWDVVDWRGRRQAIESELGTCVLADDAALISVIGEGVLANSGGTTLRSVASQAMGGRAPLASFFHPLRASFVVSAADRASVEQALHAAAVSRGRD